VTWYVVRFQGQVYTENLTGTDEKTMSALGIHGYATEAEARQHPQSMNVLQGALGGANALAGVSGSVTNIPTPGGAVQGGSAVAATVPTVGDFLARLESGTLWQRVAEVVIGGVLLVVAVKGMVPAGVQQTAKKAVKTVGWFA
jgi:hypothetical protein